MRRTRLSYIRSYHPILVILIVCVCIFADTWAPPEPQKYYSSNEKYCFEIIPSDGIGAIEDSCQGFLRILGKDEQYHQVWSTNLVNAISPVSALVSNDGDYVVTFDNWYRLGSGDDVVVIYGLNGKLIRKFGLEDILSEDEMEKIPRTVSSRWWGGEHFLDEETNILILKVVSNNEMPYSERVQFNLIEIDLEAGELLKEDDPKVGPFPYYKVDEEPKLIDIPPPKMGLHGDPIEGTTIVEALIDVDGSVIEAKILKSSEQQWLDESALEVAKKAKFSPAKYQGKCVRVWVKIPITFSISVPSRLRIEER